jgi:hypothetical protein
MIRMNCSPPRAERGEQARDVARGERPDPEQVEMEHRLATRVSITQNTRAAPQPPISSPSTFGLVQPIV